MQKPEVVARKMVAGLEKGSKSVSPSVLFSVSKVLMALAPPVRTIYWKLENAKLERFKKEINGLRKDK